VFYHAATPSAKDTEVHNVPEHHPQIKVVEEGGSTFLHLTLDPLYPGHKLKLINTAALGKARVPKAAFDAPDGTPIDFDMDYFGKRRDSNNVTAGPFTGLAAGTLVLKVW
jgi:hypothetical protein